MLANVAIEMSVGAWVVVRMLRKVRASEPARPPGSERCGTWGISLDVADGTGRCGFAMYATERLRRLPRPVTHLVARLRRTRPEPQQYEALRAAVMDRALPAMREAGDPLARAMDAEIAMRQDRRRRAAQW